MLSSFIRLPYLLLLGLLSSGIFCVLTGRKDWLVRMIRKNCHLLRLRTGRKKISSEAF